MGEASEAVYFHFGAVRVSVTDDGVNFMAEDDGA
jgi:hypothetical protein